MVRVSRLYKGGMKTNAMLLRVRDRVSEIPVHLAAAVDKSSSGRGQAGKKISQNCLAIQSTIEKPEP